jgi:hypothetical protein
VDIQGGMDQGDSYLTPPNGPIYICPNQINTSHEIGVSNEFQQQFLLSCSHSNKYSNFANGIRCEFLY